MKFSKRVVFVNTLIVIIPLFILLVFFTVNGLKRQLENSRKSAVDILNASVSQINEKMETFNLLETLIKTNETIRLYFISPQSYDEEEVISILMEESRYMESAAKITPYLYSMRLFALDPSIPERWPIILQASRLTENDKKEWSFNYHADYLGNQNAAKMPSVCRTREIYKNHKLICYMQIAVKMEDFFPLAYAELKDDNYEFVLQEITYSDDSKRLENISSFERNTQGYVLTNKERSSLQNLIMDSGKTSGVSTLNSWNRIVAWQYIPQMNIYMVHLNLGRDLAKELWMDLSLIVLGIVGFIWLMIFAVRFITNNLLSGIYTLIEGMQKVRQGDYTAKITVNSLDEVGQSQETFNEMTKQLSEQIDQIKKEQSLIADTEMKAMQNQINAHFLYNVLETIRMQAVLADQDEIAESLQILGKMMRYCLRWRVHRVSLNQEIEYIRSYVYILNIRNDYKITLEIDIPEEYMDIEIPKMTLQPLIENAFVHAIEATEADATLKIFAEMSPDKSRIYLSVEDFGCGMEEEVVKKIENYLADSQYERDSTGSIGLKNIQQRLSVFYGEDYKVRIESKVGEGTIISVPVPNVRSES